MKPLFAFIAAVVLAPGVAADAPTAATFDADGVKLSYLTHGDGEPVVLLHGLHASGELNWQLPGIVKALAGKYRVIALDFPGHGRSDKPDAEAAYGLQMVEDVVLLMDHLKLPKAHVVGYSMGGMVTMKLLAKHPDRVRSALVCGMGWFREGTPVQRFLAETKGRSAGWTPAACVRGMAKLAVTEDELKAIRAPVGVVVGDADGLKRLFVTPLREARKDWPVVEIEAAGHLTCVLKPRFAEEIAKWLDKQP